jgi:chitodextrinase
MRRLLFLFLALFSLPAFAQVPDAPTNLTAQAIENESIRLTWTAAFTGGIPSGYRVFRDNVEITTTPVVAVTFTDSATELVPGTQYTYFVRAVNNEGSSGNSNSVTATPLAIPVAPTGLTATSPTSTTVVLNWNDVPGATGYTVYRDGDEVATPTASTFTDTGLDPNTEYEYTVDATTSGGTSAESAPVSVTTRAVGDAKQEAWTRAFRKDDANLDGEISWEEYLLAKGGRLSWVIVRNRFVNTDKDADEFLSLAEYANALGGRRFFPPSRLGQFLLADLDESGLLEVDEYALTLPSRTKESAVIKKFNKLNKDDEDNGLSQQEFGIRRGTGAP